MPSQWLFGIGILIGSISPLLTFARLFQMKEWRIDRLAEHLRREGWLRGVGGRLRVLPGAAYAIALAAVLLLGRTAIGQWNDLALNVAILLVAAAPFLVVYFAALSVFDAVRRMHVPRWTPKAILIVATAIAMLFALSAVAVVRLPISSFGEAVVLLPLLVVSQPAFVLLAWAAWKPLDWVMKRRLLSRAAMRRATLKNATVIGIVGSVGKTTTKELLACLLADKQPIVTPEHVNTELGVAAWLLKNVPAGTENAFLIVEMGAYRAGEIATLCRVAGPTCAVVTALGGDHLALFGSEDAIIEANAEILDALPEGANVFLYRDNERTAALEKRTHRPTFAIGTDDVADLRETDRGIAFEAYGARFNAALHGRHNAGNVAVALAVANAYGVAPERMRELLAGYRGPQRTFHLRTERGVPVLDDTYNVSPLSFRAALDWAAARPERPRVLLTSGLLETGRAEHAYLRALGEAANASVERAVFTTDAGRAAFAEGFGRDVELLGATTEPVTDDGLLACVGRMPPTTIQRMLPAER